MQQPSFLCSPSHDAYGLKHSWELMVPLNAEKVSFSAEPGAKIAYGHKAQSRQEFGRISSGRRWSVSGGAKGGLRLPL